MKAIEVAETGGPEVLTYIDKEQPSPGPGEVVIKAEAIGVNFLDTYFRSGQYPREVPFIVGAEVMRHRRGRRRGRRRAQRRRPGRHRAGQRCLRRILRRPSRFLRLRARGCQPRRGGRIAAQGHDRALPDHVGVSGSGGRRRARARRCGRRRTHPHAMGHQPGGARDHHRVDIGESRASRKAGAVEVLDYPEDPEEFGAKIKEMTDGGVAAVYDGVGADTFDASLASLRDPRHAGAVRRVQWPRSAIRPAAAQRGRFSVSDPADARALHPHAG